TSDYRKYVRKSLKEDVSGKTIMSGGVLHEIRTHIADIEYIHNDSLASVVLDEISWTLPNGVQIDYEIISWRDIPRDRYPYISIGY
ncbi:MAG: hypothetical protein AAF740_12665, partial [Bacteroidota bacterium]